MKALRRISLKPRFLSLTPTTAIKHSLSKTNLTLTKQDDDNNMTPNNINKSHIMLAASAAAAVALTPAGYAIPPIGVTVLSNLPLCAFAFVQASGLSPLRQIFKEKATGDLSPFPFISLYTNCAIWTLYGILQQDQTILIANIAGTIVGAVYTGMFAKYTHVSMMKYYVGSGAILGLFLSSPMWASALGTDAATILGTFGMSTAVILMASPLAVVGTVIKQKSTAALPFPVSLAMTMNGLCWGSYGWFVTDDFYVYFPNILGFAAG
eukprot:931090_1